MWAIIDRISHQFTFRKKFILRTDEHNDRHPVPLDVDMLQRATYMHLVCACAPSTVPVFVSVNMCFVGSKYQTQ